MIHMKDSHSQLPIYTRCLFIPNTDAIWPKSVHVECLPSMCLHVVQNTHIHKRVAHTCVDCGAKTIEYMRQRAVTLYTVRIRMLYRQ